jgi:hypothetical protein
VLKPLLLVPLLLITRPFKRLVMRLPDSRLKRFLLISWRI